MGERVIFETTPDTVYVNLFFPAWIDLIKVMLHETIRNDDFQRNTALQHCCDIISNGYNIVSAL